MITAAVLAHNAFMQYLVQKSVASGCPAKADGINGLMFILCLFADVAIIELLTRAQ